ncbi:MAG TPA: type II toxin-antitoxin system RelE/ParE family toxin [Pyrinomonadaceae bacterium]|jgi:plasmid stabilization system protein ParE|nr:type II toxin-antitoxin system RelE/ParE family toxin [Pyrinomonadaceae bacterium]
MIIRFTPDADTELAEAREWYAHQRANLDLEFMECIDDALSRVARDPQLYPAVYGTLRRIVVRRFPFAVFYEITPSEIQVIAVFHSRRDPEGWKSRLG